MRSLATPRESVKLTELRNLRGPRTRCCAHRALAPPSPPPPVGASGMPTDGVAVCPTVVANTSCHAMRCNAVNNAYLVHSSTVPPSAAAAAPRSGELSSEATMVADVRSH